LAPPPGFNGLDDGDVLFEDLVDVGEALIEVSQVFLDADEEEIDEALHQVDLNRVLYGTGDSYVK
jgi:hypothetical protein